MQRRKFIHISAIGGTVISLTGLSCGNGHHRNNSILDKPLQLSQICDTRTIREIGLDYRLKTPAEADARRLEELLTADSAGNPVSSSPDNLTMQELMNQKVLNDFEKGNTVVVKGWVLAVTEARQCALFFVNNQ